MIINKLSFRVLLVVSILSSSFSSAQDWPQWRGLNRDSRVTGFKAPSAWPAALKQEWKVQVGSGDATPVLSGNKIYLNTRQGDQEVVLCLDAATGKELWKNQYPAAAVTGPASSHPGPRSTPALSDGKLITFGVTEIISCFNAGTGKLLWRHENPDNIVPQWFSAMSPLITDNTCIIHTGTNDKGEVLVLDLNTGNEIWKWNGDGPSYSSPSIMVVDGKKQIIVQTEKNLIALSFTDGKLLWQVSTPAQQRYYNCVSPYINGQIIFFTGQGSGTKAIRVEKSGNAFTAKELWSNNEVGAKWNTPILKDGLLYGFSDQRRIYCLNASSGQTAWIDNVVNSDFSTIVDCGAVIIGLTSTDNLIVFKPGGKAYSEIAKYKVSDSPIYTYPIVAGDKIYIKDAETLTLYKTE